MTALRPGRAGFNDRDTQGSLWLRIDVSIILLSLGILAIGLVVVYSATRGILIEEDDVYDRSFVERQIMFVAVGAFLAGLLTAIDYRRARPVVPLIYVGTIVLLLGLFVFGRTFNNATSWYSFGAITLQPSEFAKITLILALSSWFSNAKDRDGIGFVEVMLGLAITGVLAVLVLAQPDYGTVMVYGAIVAAIVTVAGVRPLYLAAVLGILVGLVALAVGTGQLASYQLDRFTAFADANSSERYNVNQSEIAIGNGGLTGQGLFEGTQNNNSLVPEKETDFIFSVLGEELGFVGGAIMLTLFAFLLMRIWRIAHLAENEFGQLIATGVFAMFLFQTFQSVGMNMGMMPVTGIPLPLISYGGSSMLTSLLALGLVENVHAHRLR